MRSLLRRNDWIRTGAAVPSVILRLGLIVLVAVAAALLIPVLGWQIAAVATAALGVVLPQTFGGWMSIACLAVGMVMSEPSVWRALVAVLVVHLIHVASSLMLVVPWRGRVVLAALRPTLRRLLLVQLVAQPLTLLVMLLFLSGGSSSDGITVEGAAIVGAAALAMLSVLFLVRLRRG